MNLLDIVNYLQSHYSDANIQPIFRLAYMKGFQDCKNMVIACAAEKAIEVKPE
jgi:hypothetical protein